MEKGYFSAFVCSQFCAYGENFKNLERLTNEANMPDSRVHACNPVLGEAEEGGLAELSPRWTAQCLREALAQNTNYKRAGMWLAVKPGLSP